MFFSSFSNNSQYKNLNKTIKYFSNFHIFVFSPVNSINYYPQIHFTIKNS